MSAAGKPYLTGLVAVSSGDKEAMVNLMVFDADLQTLLASLRKGDSISAMGGASVNAYLDKSGTPQAGLGLMVNRLMAMTDRQAAPKPRTERRPTDSQQYQPVGSSDFGPDLDDEGIPF